MALAIAAFAVISMNGSSAQAQDYSRGYGFGAGFGFGQGQSGFNRNSNRRGGIGPIFGLGRIGFSPREEEPPFFAKYPPVYYSHIVRRPYGISPFAAPPGIAPVELSVPAVQPVTIDNPFFNQEAAPVSSESVAPVELELAPASDDVTWIPNPYIETFAFNN